MHLVRPIEGILSVARRFARDQSGNYAIIVAILIPVLIGFAALAAEYGFWVYKHRAMLSAADAAAVSAATAGSNIASLEANAITAEHGYVNGVNGTAVTVNQPPLSGSAAGNANAVEVIVQQPQARLLSALFGSEPIMIQARAVAKSSGGIGCVLALNTSASGGVTMSGSANVNLNGCGLYVNSASSSAMLTGGTLKADSVNVVGGISGSTSGITASIHAGVSALADPYESVPVPSVPAGPCAPTNLSSYPANSVHCGKWNITGGGTVTFEAGNHFFVEGSELNVGGNSTITGRGVTMIFTSRTGANWPEVRITSATVDLTAPTSGTYAGLVMFGDRRMSTGTEFKLTGGGTQSFGGAIYLPKAELTFIGSSATSSSCTQIIADTITFTGNSELRLNCSGAGTKAFGSATAQLVE